MQDNKKIVGIVYAYDTGDEYNLVKDLGVRWIRLNIPFPWSDKMFGTLSDDYNLCKKQFMEAHENGMLVMPSTPGMGGFTFDEKLGKTHWHDSFPDFAGVKGSKNYYEQVAATTKFICEDLGELASDLWQCMNEIDIPVFSNDYPDEIIANTARASAEGIVSANPQARCGINLSQYYNRGVYIADLVYRPGHVFKYIGVDQYFGSWQEKTVEAWTDVIDALYARYQLPVLVNEWGYSSGGRLTAVHPDPNDLPIGWPDVCYVKSWFHEVEGGHTPEVQAEYLRRGHEIFASHPHVLGSFMFCWRDAHHCYHCGQSECPAECFWGIVDLNCKPKPAYYAVKKAIAEYYRK